MTRTLVTHRAARYHANLRSWARIPLVRHASSCSSISWMARHAMAVASAAKVNARAQTHSRLSCSFSTTTRTLSSRCVPSWEASLCYLSSAAASARAADAEHARRSRPTRPAGDRCPSRAAGTTTTATAVRSITRTMPPMCPCPSKRMANTAEGDRRDTTAVSGRVDRRLRECRRRAMRDCRVAGGKGVGTFITNAWHSAFSFSCFIIYFRIIFCLHIYQGHIQAVESYCWI